MRPAYRPGSRIETPDEKCTRIAASQHGIIGRRQALDAGISTSGIGRRLAAGRWERTFPGVYVIAGVPSSFEQSLSAVSTWAGEGATVSHRPAARLLGFETFDQEVVLEISLPTKTTAPSGVIVHTLDHSWPSDTGICHGFRLTSPARTLLDLGAVVDADRVEFALEGALRRGQVTIPRLTSLLERVAVRGLPGVGVLRRLVEDRNSDYAPTRSQLEVRMKRIIKRCRLSVPEREYRVELPDGGEAYLDFAYPKLLLGIEVDGYEYHSGRERWRRDMHRENQLKRLGWVILHFSWDDILYRPEEVVNEIKDALVGLTRLL